MSKAIHPHLALPDFFANQYIISVSTYPEKIRETSYIPENGKAKFLVMSHHTSIRAIDTSNATHEIGHFITAPLKRLHLIDYGYKNLRGEWPAYMMELELDVFARQIIILRKSHRYAMADVVLRYFCKIRI